jgi:hypothetical protein
MSISTQASSSDSNISSNWKIWRLFNSLIIIFSFFTPWIVFLGNKEDYSHAIVKNGFQLLDFLQNMTRFQNSLLHRNWLESIQELIGSPLIEGIVAILIYCIINTCMLVLETNLTRTATWVILRYCLLALGIRCLWFIAAIGLDDFEHWYKVFSFTLLGYWLTLFGLVSSTVLETYFLLSRRKFSESVSLLDNVS